MQQSKAAMMGRGRILCVLSPGQLQSHPALDTLGHLLGLVRADLSGPLQQILFQLHLTASAQRGSLPLPLENINVIPLTQPPLPLWQAAEST